MPYMNVNRVPAAGPVPAAPAREKSAPAAAGKPSSDVLDLSDIGLGKITRCGNDSPLASQILGYGSVSAERTDSEQYRFGNMTQRFTVHCDWTYVDLVNHTITRTVSHGEGLNWSDSESGTRVSAFAGVTASVTFSAERYFSGQLDDVSGALAASHEVMARQLENTLHGGELKEGLSRLEDIYARSRERAEDSFADMLVQFADRDSKREITAAVKESVRALFTGYEARCRALYDEAKLGGETNLYTAAAQLRRLVSASGAVGGKGLFSLRELDFAAVSVSAWRGIVSAAAQGGGGSEARQALSVSFTAMKAEAMYSRSLIGRGMAGFLRLSAKNVRAKLLEAMDAYFAYRREQGGSAEDFPAADGQMYDGVYASAAGAFGMTGDAVSSLRAGADTARALLADGRAAAARFAAELSAGGYWSSFDGRDYRSAAFAYGEQWRAFIAGLEDGTVSSRA